MTAVTPTEGKGLTIFTPASQPRASRRASRRAASLRTMLLPGFARDLLQVGASLPIRLEPCTFSVRVRRATKPT